MNKYRVVIRAFTLRRDVGIAIVLARVLEAKGCEVLVASSRNFQDILINWRPHAVVINTNSQIDVVKRCAPEAALICLHGEGAQSKDTSYVLDLSRNPERYEQLDRVLVWGRRMLPWFEELMPKQNHEGKVFLCGNPRLDLIKYNPNIQDASTRTGVGVTGRFHQLNYFDGRPTIFALMKEENLLPVIKQAESFTLVAKVVRFLTENTDIPISIRPHPLEAPEGYDCVLEHISSKIEIDASLDFVDWASRQRVIMMPSSTSFLEAYLLKVPLLNISRITEDSGRTDEPLAAMSQKLAMLPGSFEELLEMLNGELPDVPQMDSIDEHLDTVHDWFYEGSAVLRSANAIMDTIHAHKFPRRLHWPTTAVKWKDDIRFKRLVKREPLHPNFSFKSGYHVAPPHYQTVVENILASEHVA
jgi:surface carbohydrate biosynthesis protein